MLGTTPGTLWVPSYTIFLQASVATSAVKNMHVYFSHLSNSFVEISISHSL